MLLIYTYDKTFEVSSLWLREIVFCPMRKGPLQYLPVWMGTNENTNGL